MELADLQGRHRGEKILVCGLGPSLELAADYDILSIGCNDIWPRRECRYITMFNQPGVFTEPRLESIRIAEPELWFPYEPYVKTWEKWDKFTLHGEMVGVSFASIGIKHSVNTSPLYASLIAALIFEASEVGIVGFDMTPDHRLAQLLSRIETDTKKVAEICKKAGCDVFNLSPKSAVTALPKRDIHEFMETQAQATRP